MAGFLAKAISIIFHPLIIPTIIFSMMALFAPGLLIPANNNLLYFLAFIFATTYLFPALGITTLYLSKTISSLYADSRKERIWAIGVTLFIYLGTAYLMYMYLRLNYIMMILFSGIIFSQLLAGVITIFWKISLHSIAAGGLVYFLGFMVFQYEEESLFFPFVGSVVLLGVLMSARLHLNKHYPAEVWAGGLLGMAVSFAASLLI